MLMQKQPGSSELVSIEILHTSSKDKQIHILWTIYWRFHDLLDTHLATVVEATFIHDSKSQNCHALGEHIWPGHSKGKKSMLREGKVNVSLVHF